MPCVDARVVGGCRLVGDSLPQKAVAIDNPTHSVEAGTCRRRQAGPACDHWRMAVTAGEVIATLEAAYPPELAEPWDAVGSVCGNPDETVERVLVCVDPVAATVAEAEDLGAQLIVAHHPLLLRGVHGVPADTAKGALVHRMIRSSMGMFCAHTNADAASPGVSDALAATLGVRVTRPLVPHPDGRAGIGRIGELPQPEPFGEFVSRVGAALPTTTPGVLGAGDSERPVRTVALAGGAGDSYLDTATEAGVDVYVTADLRHHPAGEHLEQRGDRPALVGLTHWASEWPWCAQAAEVIRTVGAGSVEVHVSNTCTDPWNVAASGGSGSVMSHDDLVRSDRPDASVTQSTGGSPP